MSFGTTTPTSAGIWDAFVAKTDPGGNWAWATSTGGTSSDIARSVTTLADGTAIIAGAFDVFVVKIDPAGGW